MSEKMVEEKQAPPAAPAGDSARGRFRLAMRAWVGLMAVCWGATLCHALSGVGSLGAATIGVGKIFWSGAGMGLGAALAAALFVLCFKKLDAKFDYYKPGQAWKVRSTAVLGIGAMAAFGCYAFHQSVAATTGRWWPYLFQVDLFGKSLALRPILFPSLGILGVVMLVAFLMLNRDQWAEFQIETEGELKKVSWPARKEYMGSSVVVVAVVVVVSLFLHFVDMGLSGLMKALGIGF